MLSPTTRDSSPRIAHVNLMVDTVIANLSENGLRSILRSMLATDSAITSLFEHHSRAYLLKTADIDMAGAFVLHEDTEKQLPNRIRTIQQNIRAMLGCGLCYQSLPLLTRLVAQSFPMKPARRDEQSRILFDLDGDIIQALTAVQKTLFSTSGVRQFSREEKSVVGQLSNTIHDLQAVWHDQGIEYPFQRSLAAIESLLRNASGNITRLSSQITVPSLHPQIETFTIGEKTLPRLFTGLWQLSSPSWGTASLSSILSQFTALTNYGFTSYDMADHYGDAELLFGKFRYSCTINPKFLFGATKYCIFNAPETITKEIIHANISERCHRMAAQHIDLLQFHWQDYSDEQYIIALQYIQSDLRVHKLGLCNFDTVRTAEILSAGITIWTNQVQFSLIDSRPTHKMGPLCQEHDIKLLTYGTLCGGFLSEKWLDRAEPVELFSKGITPSQRKYYDMIVIWGGWSLFQDLLQVLKDIATRHNCSISNVATRWVLDFPYVGAVIIGTRMGISDHARENLRTYGWRLDDEDRDAVEVIMRKSNRDEMVEVLGDCGGEYR